ncbi:MAG: hypothetical protein QN123_02535, partial [Armatimonadota bacterium]|nr:hypothetical protein [Armatimonadota bacterium]
MTRREVLRRTVVLGAWGGMLEWLDRLPRHPASETVGAAAAAPPAGRGRWVVKAALPCARTEVSVGALDGKAYVLGGYAAGRVDQPFNQVYDPASDT